MKKLKDILSEVSQPKAPEEKSFKDQHKVDVLDFKVGTEDQFKAKTKKKPRKADYDTGEDEKAYDAAYTESTELTEKALSQAQQRLMAMALSLKRGEMDMADASDEVKDLAKNMSMKDLEDFAKTKHKNLPYKVEEENKDLMRMNQLLALGLADKEDRAITKRIVSKLDGEEELNPTERKIALKLLKNVLQMTLGQEKIFRATKQSLQTESLDLNENPEEEIPMMIKQLYFISYAAEEIIDYLESGDIDPEEWYQNKLTYAFAQMKSLHAYMEGEKRMMGYSSEYMMYPESTQYNPGVMTLDNGSTVKVSDKDAQLLNQLLDGLNTKNRKEMEKVLKSDKSGFNEILGFAREAL